MNHRAPKLDRIIAIAPTTRGFGFGVMEGDSILVDWGLKSVTGEKNTQSLARLKELISHYKPTVIVLENCADKSSRRAPRIRLLHQRITKLAVNQKLKAALVSPKEVRRVFFDEEKGTKDNLAEILSKRLPLELEFLVPPKRRPWMSQDSRMIIFDAIALALTFFSMSKKPQT